MSVSTKDRANATISPATRTLMRKNRLKTTSYFFLAAYCTCKPGIAGCCSMAAIASSGYSESSYYYKLNYNVTSITIRDVASITMTVRREK
ncbi:hypothetical protein ICC18_24915 [Paenibacillus sp. WST5]|uniref:Uncharacterized protein n=1 Tax=Paenibacillus sedimenti TaxID=2770274 RepID=A0A926KTR3_9BACL|nr:hypothetical protein [Paenibacillus sedimenti]